MRPGMWTTSAPGDVEDMVKGVFARVSTVSQVALIRFPLLEGYGDRHWLTYIDGIKVSHDWVPEGDEGKVIAPLQRPGPSVSIHVEDGGGWADYTYDPNFNAVDFEEASANSITLRWFAGLEFQVLNDDDTQLASLSLAGLKRFTNCEKVNGHATHGKLGVAIADATGVRTVSIYNGRFLVAEGSRTGDGTVTLTERNRSGVNGSVAITYAADVELGTITIRALWPKSYQIHLSTSAISLPRTPEATVEDDGQANEFAYINESLAAGTYNYAIAQVSENGTAQSSPSTTGAKTVNAIPGFPIRVVYKQGDSTNTQVRWTARNGTDTYNIYLSPLDGAPDMTAVAMTESAGSGEHTITLPTLGAGVTGKRIVVVRAVSSAGVEEKTGAIIEIEYDAGARVARPNTPVIRLIAKNGRDVTLTVDYDGSDSKAPPGTLQVFLWEYPSGTPDYANPDAEVQIDPLENARVTQEIEVTVPSNGWWNIGVRAAGLDGVQDSNTNKRLEFVTDAAPPDAESHDALISRGGV